MLNVLILGSGSDLAQDLARKYASKGNNIWLAGRDIDFLKTFSNDLVIQHSISSIYTYFDAGSYNSHEKFLDELPKIPDICIYVIGYLGKPASLPSDWDDIQKIMESNLLGAISILNLIGMKMKTRGKGIIIGISSVAGERGRQSNYIYGSAKAGFTQYLSGLRNALYPCGIQVMTVKPGFMYTSMTEGLDLPPILTATPEVASNLIYNAQIRGKEVVYIRPIWRYIMWVIRTIPEFIFKKLKL